MQRLTARQQQVLDFISKRIEEQGYPPTIREIGEEMGIKSTNGVNDHLKALEKKGFLTRDGLKSRALRPVSPAGVGGPSIAPAAANESGPGRTSAPTSARTDGGGVVVPLMPPAGDMVSVPVLGRVAAGAPILAEEHPEATVQVDRFFLGQGPSQPVFALKVTGESMIEAGIHHGDYIFVRKQLEARRGDIVVAMVDGEATVKRYEPDGDLIRLIPENRTMEPIVIHKSDFRQTAILGIVCGVYRRM